MRILAVDECSIAIMLIASCSIYGLIHMNRSMGSCCGRHSIVLVLVQMMIVLEEFFSCLGMTKEVADAHIVERFEERIKIFVVHASLSWTQRKQAV